MFNGLFNEDGGGCVDKGGCNCTWILLIVLFLGCCGGKMKSFNVSVNPCCLILMLALLGYCGGVTVGGGK